MHDERCFLRKVIGLLEFVVADGGLRHDGLNEAGAVAHGKKMDLSARAPVVQPAAKRDRLAFVFRDILDVDNHSKLPATSYQLPAVDPSGPRASCGRLTAFASTSSGLCAFLTSYINTPSYPIFSKAMMAAAQLMLP